MVHDTHGFYSKIINEMENLSVLLLRLLLKTITLSDEKTGTMLFKALTTRFVENKGQSGPWSVDRKKPKANFSSQLNFGYLSVVS